MDAGADIYFDQAAAMRPDPEVLDFYRAAAERCYANQEAGHREGYRLRRELDRAAEELALAVAGRPMRVVWAGSGTETFQLLAALPQWRGGRIATTALEHPALTAALSRISGAELFRLPLRGMCPDPDAVAKSAAGGAPLRLLAVHQVQSELGSQPAIGALAAALRKAAPAARLLVDSIQAAGRMDLPPEADLLTVSGHKLGAPGGAALLYRPDLPEAAAWAEEFAALRHRDYRFGRPEPALMLTLAFAAKRRRERRSAELADVIELNRRLRAGLAGLRLPNGGRPEPTLPEAESSPWLLHCRLPGMQAAVVVRLLAERGVLAASGSACQAESDRPSPALTALGWSREAAYSGLRLSFGPSNRPSEAEAFLAALATVLREY